MSRPYRSKRQRPCDQCRERKLGCQTETGQPCARCHSAGLQCTFAKPPPRRPRRQTGQESGQEEQQHEHEHSMLESLHSVHASVEADPATPSQTASSRPSQVSGLLQHSPWAAGPTAAGMSSGRAPTQFVQSLDDLEDFSVQLFGTSAESDPWLLRHCSFDDAGVKCFYKVHFRNAGGVPVPLKIPIHFMIAADDLAQGAKHETRIQAGSGGDALRQELHVLVPPEYGQRLVGLFVKYVYPALPLVSRFQLGMTPSGHVPDASVLEKIPVHLLAAVYASALPFAAHDDYLCVLSTYNSTPVDRLWRLVYERLAEEIHTPHLSVLQAGLLYLHKPLLDDSRSATADTPFIWSWVGSMVGLASSLGLHIECRMWGIPAWEKRLRRRLWWAVYAEDKWRSLLMGRPPFIRREEWDVSELDAGDFVFQVHSGAHAHVGMGEPVEVPFRFLVDLAQIAETIHDSFYTLRAAQYLSENFTASQDTGRALLERLNTWYASLPETFRLPNWSKSVSGLAPYPTSIHFAYLILVVYVYRAMLRPMARSSSPPLIFDVDEMPTTSTLPVEDSSILDFADIPELESFPAVDVDPSEVSGTGETTLNAAERCASIVINFTKRLTASDFTGFWYSCMFFFHGKLKNARG